MDQEKIELTFETPAAPAVALETAAPQQAADQALAAAEQMAQRLSPEEQKMVDDFADKIDVTNTSMVMQYGAASQKKIADFSESALENVRTKDMGEVGDMITGLMTELKGFSVDEEEKGGFLWNFSNRKAQRCLQNMNIITGKDMLQ